MSKQLNSILNRLPHATASKNVSLPDAEAESTRAPIVVAAETTREKMSRIVAPVPYSLKKELKRYVADHPDETEKSLILKGLRTLGFSIADEYIEDKRKR